jgi:hypothetical protein
LESKVALNILYQSTNIPEPLAGLYIFVVLFWQKYLKT